MIQAGMLGLGYLKAKLFGLGLGLAAQAVSQLTRHRTVHTSPQNRYISSIETRLFSSHSQLTPVMQALAA